MTTDNAASSATRYSGAVALTPKAEPNPCMCSIVTDPSPSLVRVLFVAAVVAAEFLRATFPFRHKLMASDVHETTPIPHRGLYWHPYREGRLNLSIPSLFCDLSNYGSIRSVPWSPRNEIPDDTGPGTSSAQLVPRALDTTQGCESVCDHPKSEPGQSHQRCEPDSLVLFGNGPQVVPLSLLARLLECRLHLQQLGRLTMDEQSTV